MNRIGIGPEEPLFYATIIGFALYFIYLVVKYRAHLIKSNRLINQVKQSIDEQDLTIQKIEHQLKPALVQSYGPSAVENAFQGKIYKDMPVILLKISLGVPENVSYQGLEQQTWRYTIEKSQSLLVNIWDNHVASWQTINS